MNKMKFEPGRGEAGSSQAGAVLNRVEGLFTFDELGVPIKTFLDL